MVKCWLCGRSLHSHSCFNCKIYNFSSLSQNFLTRRKQIFIYIYLLLFINLQFFIFIWAFRDVGQEWGGGLFWFVCMRVWRRFVGVLRLTERPKRGCGGRFVEMVIICRIDPAVARAAGTHKLARAHVHTHTCRH